MQKRKIKRYSEAFKRQVVAEYESGISLLTLQKKYGITGKMTFTEEGDPIKCAVIVKISDAGEFEFYQQVCPE